MTMGFVDARRSQRKLRAAMDGPSGGGKTFSALRLAFSLVERGLGRRVGVIDTENGSASLYAKLNPDGIPWNFKTLNLKSYGPDQYTQAMKLAFSSGFDVVVIDSLSHAWTGEGGALDLVDKKGGNRFTAWKDVTPLHRAMVDTIINAPCHMIVTMRSKTEYVIEQDERGKSVPRRIGVAPIQREGMEYEFDVYATFDWTHQMQITKTRCHPLDGMTGVKPGPLFWTPLFEWLASDEPDDVAGSEAFAEGPSKVTEDQIKRIIALNGEWVKARGLTDQAEIDEAWGAELIPFGVGSARQLTHGQAREFIERLAGQVAAGKAMAAVREGRPGEAARAIPETLAAITGAATVVPPPAEAATLHPPAPPTPAPGPTDAQIEDIIRLRNFLIAGKTGLSNDAERDAAWVAFLEENCGVSSAMQFTPERAAEFIAKWGPELDPFGHPASASSKT